MVPIPQKLDILTGQTVYEKINSEDVSINFSSSHRLELTVENNGQTVFELPTGVMKYFETQNERSNSYLVIDGVTFFSGLNWTFLDQNDKIYVVWQQPDTSLSTDDSIVLARN